jgi:hypothetical protein
MDRLVSDIQEYLKSEEQEGRAGQKDSLQETQPARRRFRANALIGTTTLLAACAVGSITVAIMLLGFLGGPADGSIGPIWLFAAGGCGIFFSTILISSWKRLVLLARIERNTRLILESKQAANEMLEDYIRRMM